MNTAEVIYLGNLRTESTHLRSGNKLISDAPVDNKGKGEAFSPTDLTATSLASCMLTTMAIAANTHEIVFEDAKAEVLKVMANDPRRIVGIEVDLFMPEFDYNNKQKAILENAAMTCPVARSLHPDLKQTVRFHWKDE
jgi:putative redox protein